MNFHKLVNTIQLDGALTATADSIRMKSGSTAKIDWDSEKGFAPAIESLESGGGNTLVWTGDTSGRQVVHDPKSAIVNFYRISGEIPTAADLLKGIVYTQTFDDGRSSTFSSLEKTESGGDLHYLTVTEHGDVLHINMVTEGMLMNIQPYYIIATKNNAYDSGLNATFPVSGIYIIYFGNENVILENPRRSLTIYGYTKFSAVIPPMEELTVKPTAIEQNLTPQTGYQGFLSVKVEAALGGNAIRWDGTRTGEAYSDMYYRVSPLPLPIGEGLEYVLYMTQDGFEISFEALGCIQAEEGICVITMAIGEDTQPAVIVVTDSENSAEIPVGTYYLSIPDPELGDVYVSACAVKNCRELPDTVPLLQTVVISPDEDTSPFIFPDEGYDGLSVVSFEEGGTLIPENIREGVTILGVTGTYTGA